MRESVRVWLGASVGLREAVIDEQDWLGLRDGDGVRVVCDAERVGVRVLREGVPVRLTEEVALALPLPEGVTLGVGRVRLRGRDAVEVVETEAVWVCDGDALVVCVRLGLDDMEPLAVREPEGLVVLLVVRERVGVALGAGVVDGVGVVDAEREAEAVAVAEEQVPDGLCNSDPDGGVAEAVPETECVPLRDAVRDSVADRDRAAVADRDGDVEVDSDTDPERVDGDAEAEDVQVRVGDAEAVGRALRERVAVREAVPKDAVLVPRSVCEGLRDPLRVRVRVRVRVGLPEREAERDTEPERELLPDSLGVDADGLTLPVRVRLRLALLEELPEGESVRDSVWDSDGERVTPSDTVRERDTLRLRVREALRVGVAEREVGVALEEHVGVTVLVAVVLDCDGDRDPDALCVGVGDRVRLKAGDREGVWLLVREGVAVGRRVRLGVHDAEVERVLALRDTEGLRLAVRWADRVGVVVGVAESVGLKRADGDAVQLRLGDVAVCVGDALCGGVRLRVGDRDGVPVGDGVDAVGEGLGLGRGERVGLGDGEALPLRLGVRLRLQVSVLAVVTERVAVGDRETEAEGDTLQEEAVPEAVVVNELDGLGEADQDSDVVRLQDCDGDGVGDAVAEDEGTEERDADAVGVSLALGEALTHALRLPLPVSVPLRLVQDSERDEDAVDVWLWDRL